MVITMLPVSALAVEDIPPEQTTQAPNEASDEIPQTAENEILQASEGELSQTELPDAPSTDVSETLVFDAPAQWDGMVRGSAVMRDNGAADVTLEETGTLQELIETKLGYVQDQLTDVTIETARARFELCRLLVPADTASRVANAGYCAGGLRGDLVIPDNIEEIQESAFGFSSNPNAQYAQFSSLTLSKNLKKQGASAFFAFQIRWRTDDSGQLGNNRRKRRRGRLLSGVRL